MPEDIVRYRPGDAIDTSKILEIIGLQSNQWTPVERAYPEVATAGHAAAFRRERNVTIFPPSFVPPKLLRAILGVGDRMHFAYPHPNALRPTAVLVYVVGGYASLHIYRLRPGRRP